MNLSLYMPLKVVLKKSVSQNLNNIFIVSQEIDL